LPRPERASERTCIVTRRALPVDALIRFVVAPDGSLVPDLRRRLPGRGVWVSASADKVRAAEKKRLFARAFAAPVVVAPGLAGRVDDLLQAAAVSALSLARKAGTLVNGFTRVEAALAAGRVVALIHAREAAAGGIARLTAAARRTGRRLPEVVDCFSGAQLDLAFGRAHVIHAALLAGPASEHALARVADLVAYRGGDGDAGGGDRKTNASIELEGMSAGR